MSCLHWRIGRALALAIAGVWMVTLALGDTAVTPAMHCPRGHMPCCPQQGGESCSGVRCTEQVSEKAEPQIAQAREEASQAAAPQIQIQDTRHSAPEPARELTGGLRYQAAVFRLKDDFRI